MHERIKALRKSLDMTQQEFAEKIGVKRSTVATYETGRSEPVDAVVSLICEKLNVNEKWLRTGEGEMFLPLTRKEEISKMADRLLKGEEESFKIRLVSTLANLTEEQWAVLADIATKLVAENDTLPKKNLYDDVPKTPEELRKLYPPIDINKTS